MRRAFTLLEILLVVALISLLMSILLMVVVRLAHLSRTTTQAALRRKHWMEAAETLRWELRNLHLPPVAKAPSNGVAGGLVGSPDTPLWGEPGQTEGLDAVSFLTTQAKRQKGVSEVGFRMTPRSDKGYDLSYREFPLRNRAGLHPQTEAQEAPWKVILESVNFFSIDYSDDGWVWRRDWSQTTVPQRIRIHLEASKLPVLDFQVTPGMGGGRW